MDNSRSVAEGIVVMKKWKILISLLLIFVLTGCGKTESETKNTKNEKEKLVIWSYYETNAQQEGLDWLVDSFNQAQDKYEISWEYVPMTDFTKKLTMAYTEEALPDIALLDNPNMAACIQMGMCEEITDYLEEIHAKENYYAATLETVTYEGKGYGVPAVCNNLALIYNKKLLSEAGIQPPQTWEALSNAAAVLTTDTTKGFLLSAKEGEQGAFQLLPWILEAGESVDSIGNEGTIKAFSYLNNLMENGYMTQNCVNLSQTDVAAAFIKGETAMMENGPWVLSMLDESGIEYGISQLPGEEKNCTIVGGEDFTIMKGKNVDGAKAFLKYYDQSQVMKRFCEKTGVLPVKVSMQLENENMRIFQKQMKNAVVRSSIPKWTKLSELLPNTFYEMVSGKKSPTEAAEDLKSGQY